MVYKMFTIRDAKAEIFHPPFYKATHGEAERDFRVLANDSKGQISQFPEDFDLYYLGEYNDQEGKMVPLDTPQHVVKAVHCVKPNQPVSPVVNPDSSAEGN